MGVETLFSGYWEDMRVGGMGGMREKLRDGGRGEETGRKGCMEMRLQKESGQKERIRGKGQFSSAGRGRLGVGRACLLKGHGTQVTRVARIIITFPSFSYNKKAKS